jgi:lipid-A-disaccharide synthase
MAAGEQSGDMLGAGLIEALQHHYPNATFEGIAGPRMIAAGCTSLYPMERLSVMGLVEVAGRYVGLMRDRKRLARDWLANPPDVFVGIDAPDFNLGLARQLREHGIKTVHYVSPSVWAWRQYRVKGIRRAVNRMLTLFPFEADFYKRAGVDVVHVGHPLADDIPMRTDVAQAREALGLEASGTLIALLPGSRMSEVSALATTLVQTADWLVQRRPDCHFVMPAATPTIYAELAPVVASAKRARVILLHGDARAAMGASEVVVLASGTATLEAMLLKKPMVITYRVHPVTYRIMKWMFTVEFVGLPNLLVGREVVPECLQDECRPERLGEQVLKWLDDPQRVAATIALFDAVHERLRGGASRRAAQAVAEVLAQ